MKGKQSIFNTTFFLVCIFAITFIMLGNQMIGYEGTNYGDEESTTAKVVELLQQEVEEGQGGFTSTVVYFTAQITSGIHKGDMVDGMQYIDEMFLPVPQKVEEGDAVLLLTTEGDGGTSWIYADHDTTMAMGVMVALFFLCILLIGRGKGVATILSLLFTMGAIFFVYIPAILSGINVYQMTVVVAVFIILSSLILLNGCNGKTLCAIVGNLGGVMLAGVLSLVFNSALGITGIVDQDYVFLTMLTDEVSIDLQAVVWSGILIGALGAIMDVAMSISSAMHELAQEMEEKSFRRLVDAGMRIGQDAIGTMTNTLILAYVGGSLAVVLLFAAYDKNMMLLLNLEMVSIEVIQAVMGSMGILLAVPLTVFFSAWLATRPIAGGVQRRDKE